MRSFLSLAFVLLLCVAGIGLYRGWFSLSSPSPDASGDKVNVNVSVDKGKISSDVKRAEEKVGQEFKQLQGTTQAK